MVRKIHKCEGWYNCGGCKYIKCQCVNLCVVLNNRVEEEYYLKSFIIFNKVELEKVLMY